jgi:hypothetical protein
MRYDWMATGIIDFDIHHYRDKLWYVVIFGGALKAVIEFLFCPIHGILRPDNIFILINLANSVIMHLTVWLRRLGMI